MGDLYTPDTLHHPPPLNIGVVQTNFPDVNPWGGGAPPSTGILAPLQAVPSGAQWTFTRQGLFGATVHVPGGSGLPGYYQTQYTEPSGPPADNPGNITAVGTDELSGPWVGTVTVHVRWCNADGPISDWSADKTVTIS